MRKKNINKTKLNLGQTVTFQLNVMRWMSLTSFEIITDP